MAVEGLQKRGQELYRQKKYEQALECFNAAIIPGNRDCVAALDNRAATHTKLGNLQAALKDGRRMIQEESISCLGYLRTGKVLQLLGKDDIAQGIYKYGIRNVPSSDPNFMLLGGMLDKLSKRCSPPNLVDPLLVLPLELAEMIMKHLSFRQIVAATRVSKSWRQLLENTPSLWSELNFSAASKPVTFGALQSYIKRSQGTVTRATFHRFTYKNSDVLKCITARCKDLHSLIIPVGFTGASLLHAVPFAKNLKTLIVGQGCEVTLDTVSQVLAICSQLVRVEFLSVCRGRFSPSWAADLTKISTLALNTSRGARDAGGELNLNVLIENIPNVRNLSLQNWSRLGTWQGPHFSSLEQLQSLDIASMSLRVFPSLPPSLQKLVMFGCFDCNLGSAQSRDNIIDSNMTNLISLSMANVTTLHTLSLHDLLEPNKGNLKELNVNGCPFLDATSMLLLGKAGYLKEVVSLDMGNCNMDDRGVESLMACVPRLRYLALERTKITGVGVKAAVLKPEDNLEHLFIHNCQDVSRDAVEFARARGVKVEYYFPDVSRSGRRVRLE